MKTLKTIIFLTLCSLAFACDKEDNPPADPRLAFAGNYKSAEHDVEGGVTGTEAEVVPVHGGIEVVVKLSTGNPEALEIDLKELVTEVIGSFPTESFTVEFDHLPIALISGNSFELESTEFTVTTLNQASIGTMEAEGTINGNKLSLEYEFSIPIPNTSQFLNFRSNEKVELQKQ